MVIGQRRYLIAYDISDDVRRSHVVKTLQSHGMRLQYSVFLLEVRKSALLKVKAALEDEIDNSQDSVLICDLDTCEGSESAMTFMGRRGYRDVTVPQII